MGHILKPTALFILQPNVVAQLDSVLSYPQHWIMVWVHDRKRKYIGVTTV